jgi:hypothetical protein
MLRDLVLVDRRPLLPCGAVFCNSFLDIASLHISFFLSFFFGRNQRKSHAPTSVSGGLPRRRRHG